LKTERQIKRFKCELSDPDFKGRPKKTERLISNKDSPLLGLDTGGSPGTDDEVFELNPQGGLFIPDGADYWFESASDTPLKILRMSAGS
jgi:hypothetical protein